MSTLAIDTYKLLTALRGTGKSANFTAEEIANAIDVAQEGASSSRCWHASRASSDGVSGSARRACRTIGGRACQTSRQRTAVA
jgi:hypothetical protein